MMRSSTTEVHLADNGHNDACDACPTGWWTCCMAVSATALVYLNTLPSRGYAPWWWSHAVPA
jgi:hypothetical protein